MGVIISRFRKEKSTFQKLEGLEEKIKDLEAYTISTQERRKRFVGRFLVTSIGLYVLGSLIFFFVFFPPTWKERTVYSVPLLICPVIIFILKRVLAWHYERKLLLNANKLKELRSEKKQILEKVMEKETYKVAVEILDKFGEKSHRLQTQAFKASLTPQSSPKPMPVAQSAQRLPVPNVPQRQISTPVMPIRSGTPVAAQIRSAGPMRTFQTAPGLMVQPHIHQQQSTPRRPNMAYRRTPFPIINHNQKGVLEKMVDYLVGDGPNNRFAMICTECCMHNGMALEEEYEYTAFRCAFCSTLNPAKKQRPVAPRLPFEQVQFDKLSQKPESNTGSENEEDDSGSSSSSQSGEPRSPGVGEEEPPESVLSQQGEMHSHSRTTSDSGVTEEIDEAKEENSDLRDEENEKLADSTGKEDVSVPVVPEVPSRPETVGSKKVD